MEAVRRWGASGPDARLKPDLRGTGRGTLPAINDIIRIRMRQEDVYREVALPIVYSPFRGGRDRD